MKAAIFEKPGLENLKVIDDAPEPKLSDNDVLIKVKVCGINPIDYFVTSGITQVKSNTTYTWSRDKRYSTRCWKSC